MIIFVFEIHSYPKGLIVAFTLKSKEERSSKEGSGNEEQANAGSVSLKADEEEKHLKNIDEEKDNKESEVSDTTGQESEENVDGSNDNEEEGNDEESDHEDKSSEVPPNENNKRKLNASDYKNDQNVVMREDLKTRLGKFGTVKVITFSLSPPLCFPFLKVFFIWSCYLKGRGIHFSWLDLDFK